MPKNSIGGEGTGATMATLDVSAMEKTLLELAAQEATGRLTVVGVSGQHGWVWLRDGQVAGASGPGPRPLLAHRLRTYGVLSQDKIAKALDFTLTNPGMRLVDVLHNERLVPREFLEQTALWTNAEQLHYLGVVGEVQTKFDNGQVSAAGPLLVPAHAVVGLSKSLVLHRDAVPTEVKWRYLGDDVGKNPLHAAVAEACDGTRDVSQIAHVCGLTIHETLESLQTLLDAQAITADLEESEWTERTITSPERDPEAEVVTTEPPVTEAEESTEVAPAKERPATESSPEETQTDQADSGETVADNDDQEADESEEPTVWAEPVELAKTTAPLPSAGPKARPITEAGDPTERRGAFSELAAMGQDLAAPVAEEAPTEPAKTERPANRESAKQTYTSDGPQTSRKVASELFRELHNLGEQDRAKQDSPAKSDAKDDSKKSSKKKKGMFGRG